jgi:hypothetical protein
MDCRRRVGANSLLSVASGIRPRTGTEEEVTIMISTHTTLMTTAPLCLAPANRPASLQAVRPWATAAGVTGQDSVFAAQVDVKAGPGVAVLTRRPLIEKHVPGIPPRGRPV